MKNNLISAIAGWKSAALLALVAMVAAVAFSGVLSTSQTAQAADIAVDDTTNAATAAPGDTVQLTVAAALVQATITGTADGVSASFVANGGQTIACAGGNSCDKDGGLADQVRVDLKVAADAGEGYILVEIKRLGITTPSTVTKVITVSKGTLVGSLAIKAVSSTIAADDDNATVGDGGANETMITVNVKNAATSPAGLNTQSVTLVTTLGTLRCADGGTPAQACSVSTADSVPGTTPGIASTVTAEPGWATVLLIGGGVEGKATITATLGSLSKQIDVTMYGTAKNLTAKPEQGSVEIGGSVYIVLTVTDNAGNPVAGAKVNAGTPAEVVGPSKTAVKVVTERNTPSRTDFTDDAPGVGYSKDKVGATAAGNIPACGEDNSDTDGTTGGSQELFATEGTNDKGQCVVYVTAPENKADATKNATRGEHTLHFVVDGVATVKASAVIEVAGKPASITTDAPESVDPGSVTEITVSVWDDADVLVGITNVRVRKVDGGGLIEDEGEGGSEPTSDGQSKFTFIAPSTPGSSEILITTGVGAGTVNHRVSINIGEPPAPEPEGPAPTWNNPLFSGQNLVSWQGEDGADPSAGASEGVIAIWSYNAGTGQWDAYFVDAADVPGGTTLTSLTHGDAYFVIVE